MYVCVCAATPIPQLKKNPPLLGAFFGLLFAGGVFAAGVFVFDERPNGHEGGMPPWCVRRYASWVCIWQYEYVTHTNAQEHTSYSECIKNCGSWSFARRRLRGCSAVGVGFVFALGVACWIPSGLNISHIIWFNTQRALAPIKEAPACVMCNLQKKGGPPI